MFEDRTDAGLQLAEELAERDAPVDLVLAVPRGGLPPGHVVADRLGVPLDVVAATELGAPDAPELVVGAVAGDGSLYRNDDLIRRLDVSDDSLAERRREAAETAREREATYRADPQPDLRGERVVIVDDGLATVATAVARVRKVNAGGAARVVQAAPVGAHDAVDEVAAEADEVVVLETPAPFGSLASHYRDFSEVSDAEAMAYLER